jgi:hypothetical protein
MGNDGQTEAHQALLVPKQLKKYIGRPGGQADSDPQAPTRDGRRCRRAVATARGGHAGHVYAADERIAGGEVGREISRRAATGVQYLHGYSRRDFGVRPVLGIGQNAPFRIKFLLAESEEGAGWGFGQGLRDCTPFFPPPRLSFPTPPSDP